MKQIYIYLITIFCCFIIFFSIALIQAKFVLNIETLSWSHMIGPLTASTIFGILTSILIILSNKLKIKNIKLDNLNKLKNHFLGMAAHDIRGPLSAIIGFSDILKDENYDKKERQKYVQIINSSSKNLLSLVNSLLDVSMIENGKLELQLLKVSLPEILTEKIELYSYHAKKKSIVLKTEIIDNLDILIDKERISQAFENILSNAIKYSTLNSSIKIRLLVEQKCAIIQVDDEGPGFSKKDMSYLFKEYKTLSAKPTGGERSTGLGLSIANKIIIAHNGKLLAENLNGKGSRFSIILNI